MKMIWGIGVAVVGALGIGAAVTMTGGDAQHQAASDDLPMVQVALPTLGATAQLGQKAFSENCAACHGENASGRDGYGPPLIHKIYEPGHHGDMSFLLAVRRGVTAHHWRFGNMPLVEGLSDNRVAAIVTYVREVQRANGIY